MTSLELKEEIAIELEAMSTVVNEAVALYHDITERDATIRENSIHENLEETRKNTRHYRKTILQ